MTKFIGIIPARSGSKGVSNKNIRDLGGMPLILWSVVQAISSKLDAVIVDSDSTDYLKLVGAISGVETNHRPSHLAEDTSLTVDVVKNVIFEKRLDKDDFILLLQPTCPFRTADMINDAITSLRKNPNKSVVSLEDVDGFHPLRMKQVIGGEVVNYIDTGIEDMRPRQRLPKVYIRSGAIYGSKVASILKNDSLLTNAQMPLFELGGLNINIDSIRDLLLAEAMLTTSHELKTLRNMNIKFLNQYGIAL